MAPLPKTVALTVAPAALGPAAIAQSTPAPTVPGYVLTVETRALAPEVKPPGPAAPEARALMEKLRGPANLTSRIFLGQDLSRQEIVSADFVLPAGTVLLHKAGDRFYVIADPQAKTYLVVQKHLASELGFPMEVKLLVTQGTGRKAGAAAPGSLRVEVTEVKKERALDSELFRIPPAGYRRVEKSPYFKDGAAARTP